MRLFVVIFFSCLIINSFAQGIDNLWLMGYENISGLPLGGTDFNFSGGSINISYHPRLMNFLRTNGVISNSSGNLLFSSNGVFIANANNDTMLNGSELNPSYYSTHNAEDGLNLSQANIVIPFPSDTSKYYLFHVTSDDYGVTYSALNLYYTIVDMSLDSGKGAVTLKNSILLNDSLVPGMLTACKHANGRDWWLISHQYNSNMFYKFLISTYGITGPFTQNIGSIRFSEVTQSQFSKDGRRYVNYEPGWNDLDLFDFDRCSGNFSNLVHIDFQDSAYIGGVAFSPSSNILYVSSTSYVYQFDLTAANVPASQTTVAVWDGFYSPQFPFATTFYLSQLAPDGKIYINCGNSTLDMHVINYPDSLGMACGVCQHCIHLPAFKGFTIPNYPNYFLGSETGTICDSLTSILERKKSVLKLEMFPNPITSENVTFTYSTLPKTGIILLFNLDGKEVAKYYLPQWSSMQHVKLPKVASGVYLARLEMNGEYFDVKFIVD